MTFYSVRESSEPQRVLRLPRPHELTAACVLLYCLQKMELNPAVIPDCLVLFLVHQVRCGVVWLSV